MTFGKKLTFISLLTACGLSTQAMANEQSGIESIVSSYVQAAVSATKLEIDTQIQQSIVTASHYFSFGESEDQAISTKVTITDLDSVDAVTPKVSNDSDSNLEQESDD